MGTYGVTHIKKDNKIISFSDSYDGYMSGGMGQSNVLCIKFFSTSTLKRLFDSYTFTDKVPVSDADKYIVEEVEEGNFSITQREIENVLFMVRRDTGNEEAVSWMSAILSSNIRASCTGVVPLMYLNTNTHYNRDYDYYDYLIDLDDEVFVNYNGVKVSFEKIRMLSVSQIDELCKGSYWDEELEDEDESEGNLSIEDFFANLKPTAASPAIVVQVEDEWVINLSKRPSKKTAKRDVVGFSLRSTNFQAITTLVVSSLMQRLIKIKGCEYLLDRVEWGVNEDFSKAGMRILSISEGDYVKDKINEMLVSELEKTFKFGFNVFAGASTLNEIVNGVDYVFNNVEPISRSALSIKEWEKEIPDSSEMFSTGAPSLAIYGLYDEMRGVVFNVADIKTAVVWFYMSILFKDKDMFARMYSFVKKDLAVVSESAKEKSTKQFLNFFWNMKAIDRIYNNFARMLKSDNELEDDKDFIDFVKSDTSFFTDVSPYLYDWEKERFL